MPDNVRRRKTFVVRSLIYEGCGYDWQRRLAYTSENLDMVTKATNREFDLP